MARGADEGLNAYKILASYFAAFNRQDAEAMPALLTDDVVHELNLSRTEVHGVVSFYHDFCEEAYARPEE